MDALTDGDGDSWSIGPCYPQIQLPVSVAELKLIEFWKHLGPEILIDLTAHLGPGHWSSVGSAHWFKESMDLVTKHIEPIMVDRSAIFIFKVRMLLFLIVWRLSSLSFLQGQSMCFSIVLSLLCDEHIKLLLSPKADWWIVFLYKRQWQDFEGVACWQSPWSCDNLLQLLKQGIEVLPITRFIIIHYTSNT